LSTIVKNKQYFKFCAYGFLKNLRFFDAFFILYLIEKELLFTQIGIMYAVREIIINILEIPSGITADTFGRKKSLAGSFAAYIVSFILFYLSNDFWFFLLAFIFYGIGDAFRSGTHKGIIMDYLKHNNWGDQKINYYGHTRSWSQMGSAVSSLIAGIIVFSSGTYQNIFLYSVIPYLLNFILIISYPAYLNRTLNGTRNKKDIRLTLKSFFAAIKQPNVFNLVNSSAVHSAFLKAVKDYIQPLLVHISLLIPFMLEFKSEEKSGIVIGVIYFLIFLLTSRSSKYSSKIENRNKHNISKITLLSGFGAGL